MAHPNLDYTLEEGATAPVYGSAGAAGIDLFAKDKFELHHANHTRVGTGVRMRIPPGHCGIICDRSGNGLTKDIQLFRGVIDSDYRGEIIVGAKQSRPGTREFPAGFKLAQMVIVPVPRFALIERASLDETARGDAGFGSTDPTPAK